MLLVDMAFILYLCVFECIFADRAVLLRLKINLDLFA